MKLVHDNNEQTVDELGVVRELVAGLKTVRDVLNNSNEQSTARVVTNIRETLLGLLEAEALLGLELSWDTAGWLEIMRVWLDKHSDQRRVSEIQDLCYEMLARIVRTIAVSLPQTSLIEQHSELAKKHLSDMKRDKETASRALSDLERMSEVLATGKLAGHYESMAKEANKELEWWLEKSLWLWLVLVLLTLGLPFINGFDILQLLPLGAGAAFALRQVVVYRNLRFEYEHLNLAMSATPYFAERLKDESRLTELVAQRVLGRSPIAKPESATEQLKAASELVKSLPKTSR